jgi:disulfide bond formation protein DsbB
MSQVEYFSFLILLSNIGFLGLVVFWKKIVPKISVYALDLASAVVVAATVGSLYLSEILLIPPCVLCWYQRILMYPLIIILVVAKVRKVKRIWEIVLPFTIMGGALSIYHYYLQFAPDSSTICGVVGIFVNCSDKPFVHYGYITIPWMCLSAFVYITALMFILRKREMVGK